jgi:hypothetical protein
MDIDEQKKQILQLLNQLNAGGTKQRAALPSGKGGERLEGGGLGERILRRRQELLELRNKRDRMAHDLLEERLLSICQMLEKRILRVEEIMLKGGGRQEGGRQDGGRQEGGPAGLPGETSDAGADTGLTSDFDAMMPDLGISATSADGGPDSAPKQVHSLSGLIEEGILPDVLQMISSNAKTGVFSIVNGQNQVDLFLKDGELYHALGEGMEGQTAFFAAMATQQGEFYFAETDEVPEEKTIDGNTQFLILEALRQIDEEGEDV